MAITTRPRFPQTNEALAPAVNEVTVTFHITEAQLPPKSRGHMHPRQMDIMVTLHIHETQLPPNE